MVLRKFAISTAFLLMPLLSVAQALDRATLGLIPRPHTVHLSRGVFTVPSAIAIGDQQGAFSFAKGELIRLIGTLPALEAKDTDAGRADIVLRHDTAIEGKEAYKLVVAPDQIVLSASHTSGALYGVMTLIQLLEHRLDDHLDRYAPIECMTITDHPRYALRGLMLDPARHFEIGRAIPSSDRALPPESQGLICPVECLIWCHRRQSLYGAKAKKKHKQTKFITIRIS